ncbi:hypothetical protein CRUP_001811 [Coryphaenoides rupestris]|nr:hypothetical protein CRUP_001811 [Coryphaenoides rupestris]
MCAAGTSRGPSPVTLASQDALPIAVAFTESVNAYFKGADPSNDPSQSDSNSKDFCFNMPALVSYLRKSAEQNPSASYYNCTAGTTDLCLDYRFNPEPMSGPGALSNVQILVPVDGGVTSQQSLPSGIWNAEQNKFLWKLSDISDKSENEGAAPLRG